MLTGSVPPQEYTTVIVSPTICRQQVQPPLWDESFMLLFLNTSILSLTPPPLPMYMYMYWRRQRLFAGNRCLDHTLFSDIISTSSAAGLACRSCTGPQTISCSVTGLRVLHFLKQPPLWAWSKWSSHDGFGHASRQISARNGTITHLIGTGLTYPVSRCGWITMVIRRHEYRLRVSSTGLVNHDPLCFWSRIRDDTQQAVRATAYLCSLL